jgi:hypothetical protein
MVAEERHAIVRASFRRPCVVYKEQVNQSGGKLLFVLRFHISFALKQKTGNFKVAMVSRLMQWSPLTYEMKMNKFARTMFCLIRTKIAV